MGPFDFGLGLGQTGSTQAQGQDGCGGEGFDGETF